MVPAEFESLSDFRVHVARGGKAGLQQAADIIPDRFFVGLGGGRIGHGHGRDGAAETLTQLSDELGMLSTFTVSTPSEGRHFYCAANGCKIGSRNDWRPNVDCKAHGGYLVAPGSTIGGKAYVTESVDADTVVKQPAPKLHVRGKTIRKAEETG